MLELVVDSSGLAHNCCEYKTLGSAEPEKILDQLRDCQFFNITLHLIKTLRRIEIKKL